MPRHRSFAHVAERSRVRLRRWFRYLEGRLRFEGAPSLEGPAQGDLRVLPSRRDLHRQYVGCMPVVAYPAIADGTGATIGADNADHFSRGVARRIARWLNLDAVQDELPGRPDQPVDDAGTGQQKCEPAKHHGNAGNASFRFRRPRGRSPFSAVRAVGGRAYLVIRRPTAGGWPITRRRPITCGYPSVLWCRAI